MWRDKENNKESDENNKKTTQGRKTIRTTKSETPKLGNNRPSTCMHSCGRTIHSADGFCRKGMCVDRREIDETTTMKWGNNEEI